MFSTFGLLEPNYDLQIEYFGVAGSVLSDESYGSIGLLLPAKPVNSGSRRKVVFW